MKSYYKQSDSKNHMGQPSHPIDNYCFWNTRSEIRDEKAKLLDLLMLDDELTLEQKFEVFKKLTQFIIEEAEASVAYNNSEC